MEFPEKKYVNKTAMLGHINIDTALFPASVRRIMNGLDRNAQKIRMNN